MRKSYATGMSKHKTLETGRKKADNTSTYNTGRKKHSSIKTGRLRISMYGGRPSKTLYFKALGRTWKYYKLGCYKAIQCNKAFRYNIYLKTTGVCN